MCTKNTSFIESKTRLPNRNARKQQLLKIDGEKTNEGVSSQTGTHDNGGRANPWDSWMQSRAFFQYRPQAPLCYQLYPHAQFHYIFYPLP